MNIQQLRYLAEVEKRGLNVSEAASALFTSQPGVSKQIRLLEDELGVQVFVRQGKRLTGVTDPGRAVLAIARRMLEDMENMRSVGREFSDEASGRLTIATTHTQARYALPPVVQRFRTRYPGVGLSLHQGNPAQVCAMVLSGEADIAIATEGMDDVPELAVLPCTRWNRCVIAPCGHPILHEYPLTLEAIARYPIITYDLAFSGRSRMNKAFAARGLHPDVAISAIDSDVIKTYVAMGLGVGIVADMAFDPAKDRDLCAMDASHLFESSTTRIGIRRNAWRRGYVYAFIEEFAPYYGRKMVDAALAGTDDDPVL